MISPPDLHFGALAVQSGYANSTQIELALDAQKGSRELAPDRRLKLGQILQDMGTLTPDQVDALLRTQERLRGAGLGHPEPLLAAGGPLSPPEMAELAAPALIQEAGPGLMVNGEPLAAPRLLRRGDVIEAGGLVLRMTGDAIEIHPGSAPAPPRAPAAPDPDSSRPAGPGALALLRTALGRLDARIASLPPAIHVQRKYVLAASAGCLATLLFPWLIAPGGIPVLGLQGPGWFGTLLLLVPVATAISTRAADPFTRTDRLLASTAATLALVSGILKLAYPPAVAPGRGWGLAVWLVGTALLLAASAVPRSASAAEGAEGTALGARLWARLRRFADQMSGQRARDLALAVEERDLVLRKMGEECLESHADLPEAILALDARAALERAAEAALRAGEGAGAARARAAQEAAEGRAGRALERLALRVLSGGAPLSQTAIADLRAAEERIRELS